MENVNITATTKTESGLEYNDPDIQHYPGETYEIKGTMKLYFDNEIVDQYIRYIEILSVNVEYVVDENEWFVNYEVGHYAFDQLLTTANLTNEDLEDFE